MNIKIKIQTNINMNIKKTCNKYTKKHKSKSTTASGVFPKWVKSNIRREKERRMKVSDYNGQYLTPKPKARMNAENEDPS